MHSKTAFITGSSGLLGTLVTQTLHQQGYNTIGLVHKTAPPTKIDIKQLSDLPAICQELDLVINLAGLPIANRLWTNNRKKALRASRIDLTESIVETLRHHNIACRHFISASAIGYYGTTETEVSENTPAGDDFTAELCRDWEQSARRARNLPAKVTLLRTGLVLSPDNGYLKPMQRSARFGVYPVFGPGKQGQSWIDYRDWLGAFNHILHHQLDGTFNLTAPHPVTQHEMIESLAKYLRSGQVFSIPVGLLSVLGEMKTLLVDGQWVLPKALQNSGYVFQYPTLGSSLQSLFNSSAS